MGNIFETFGKYKLTERLAIGGMAEVFLGTVHGEAGFIKTVVIKRLHPRLSEDDEVVQMLVDEARITAQLSHGNICQVLDLGQVDGSYYIAMEFISGEDLRTIQDHCAKRNKPLPIEAAIHILEEVLEGLHFAHTKEGSDGKPLGIVHRDVSPQNILISYEGEVKVIDFGIAKARLRMVKTEAGVIKGKFRYMSPEQATGAEALDQRTDVFAAGVVLYELLRGSPHSMNLPDTEVLRRAQKAEFDPLSNFRADLPPALIAIVKKALHRKTGSRFSTAGEFRSALVKFMTEQKLSFGRNELSAIMKSIFDVERRKRRSGTIPGLVSSPGERLVARGPASQKGRGRERSEGAEISEKDEAAPSQRKSKWVVSVPTTESSPKSKARGPVARSSTEEIEQAPTTEIDVAELERGGSAVRRGRTLPPPRRKEARGDRQGDDELADPATAPGARGASATDGELEQETHAALTRARTGRKAVTEAARSATALAPSRSVEVSPDLLEPGRAPAAVAPLPTVSTGFFSHQAQTEQKDETLAPRKRGLLRTVLGLFVVLVLGAGVAVMLYHLDTPYRQALVADGQPAEASPAAAEVAKRIVPTRTHEKGEVKGEAKGEAKDETPKKPGGLELARMGRLIVQSKPSGASITICNDPHDGTTPGEVRLPVGRTCDLELSLEGYEPYRIPVAVEGVEPQTLVATLRRSRSAATGRRGTLLVTSIQVGTVYVDDKAKGQTPRLELSLQAGTYDVKVHFPTHELTTPPRSVKVKPGQTTKVHVDPSP